MNLLSKRQAMEKDVEIDPRSVVTYDSEVKDKELNFIEKDLRRQLWLFCKQKDIDFNTLKLSPIESEPINKDDPKGMWRYSLSASIPNPVTMQNTIGASAVYPYAFLVKHGILLDESIHLDQEANDGRELTE
jgi:hypothetical protein